MSEREIVKTEGNYRAVTERDDFPHEPDGDFQAAVIRLDYNGYYEVDAKTEAGDDFENAAGHFLSYYGMRKGTEALERFLRIFHGTRDFRTFRYSSSPDSAVYVAFDSARMRGAWGCDEDATGGAQGTAAEWQAYIDGDVYVVAVEHRPDDSTEDDDWEEVEDAAIRGFYGEKWATQAAIDQLHYYAGS